MMHTRTNATSLCVSKHHAHSRTHAHSAHACASGCARGRVHAHFAHNFLRARAHTRACTQACMHTCAQTLAHTATIAAKNAATTHQPNDLQRFAVGKGNIYQASPRQPLRPPQKLPSLADCGHTPSPSRPSSRFFCSRPRPRSSAPTPCRPLRRGRASTPMHEPPACRGGAKQGGREAVATLVVLPARFPRARFMLGSFCVGRAR
jgi:hypothetical protein